MTTINMYICFFLYTCVKAGETFLFVLQTCRQTLNVNKHVSLHNIETLADQNCCIAAKRKISLLNDVVSLQ